MGTTTVKNALQYESLPTSTVSTTSSSQFMNKTFADTTYTTNYLQIAASYTGTLSVTNFFPFICSYRAITANGTFVPQMLNLSVILAATEATLLTIDLDTAAMTDSTISLTAAALTSFSAPSLKYLTSSFSLTANSLTTLNLSSLNIVPGTFTISASSLTTLNLASLVMVTSTASFTMVNMTNFTLGSTLKLFASNFVLINAKLTQASVDNILVTLAALNGSNGTTAYSSRTVNLSGGTSSTPSATGLTAKATLQARSCTVTTN